MNTDATSAVSIFIIGGSGEVNFNFFEKPTAMAVRKSLSFGDLITGPNGFPSPFPPSQSTPLQSTSNNFTQQQRITPTMGVGIEHPQSQRNTNSNAGSTPRHNPFSPVPSDSSGSSYSPTHSDDSFVFGRNEPPVTSDTRVTRSMVRNK